MRPHIAHRIAWPLAAGVWFLAMSGTAASVRLGPFAAFVIMSLAAWRGYLCLDDGVIQERGLLRWRPPFLLAEVVSITMHHEVSGRAPSLRPELRLYQSHDVRAISLTWWNNTGPLLRAVVDGFSESDGTELGRVWNVDVDARTRRRLEAS